MTRPSTSTAGTTPAKAAGDEGLVGGVHVEEAEVPLEAPGYRERSHMLDDVGPG